MVRDVFDQKQLSRLIGSMGAGHGKSIQCHRAVSAVN